MSRFPLRLAAAASLAALVAACDDGSAVTTSPVGERAFGFSLTRINDTAYMPGGAARFVIGAGDSVVLTLRGLDTLETGYYTVWFGDTAGANFKRATASQIRVTVTDTTTNAQGDPVPVVTTFSSVNVAAFQNGGYNKRITWTSTRAAAGLTATDSMSMVLVTIEPTADAATPGAHRPLWAFRDSAGVTGTNRTRRLQFGTYDPDPAQRYIFPLAGLPAGTGRGYAAIRGNELVAYDSALALPPRGYTYTSYLVRADSVSPTLRDTAFLNLGPLTAPPPRRNVSLLHADSLKAALDPTIQALPPAILAGALRFDADTAQSGPFANRTPDFLNVVRLQLNLEPKAKPDDTRPGPAIVLRGDVPSVARSPR